METDEKEFSLRRSDSKITRRHPAGDENDSRLRVVYDGGNNFGNNAGCEELFIIRIYDDLR